MRRKKRRLANIDKMRLGLPLPSLLVSLIEAGQWKHPGASAIQLCAPFIRDPLIVLPTVEAMLFNSGPLMGHSLTENESLHEYRGSVFVARDLPWIDVEKTIFIMCNERIGDDSGIALDYRLSVTDPQVIGSDWHSDVNGVRYRRIAESSPEFAAKIGLPTDIE